MPHSPAPTRLACWLTALAACAAPLLVQAQTQKCTSPNTTADYILGDANGQASAMHWESGLVWRRCSSGENFDSDSNTCTGTATTRTWNAWAGGTLKLLPLTFEGQEGWGISASLSQNLLQSGAWRMPYYRELNRLGAQCHRMDPEYRINPEVFPSVPPRSGSHPSYWTGSPGNPICRIPDDHMAACETDPAAPGTTAS